MQLGEIVNEKITSHRGCVFCPVRTVGQRCPSPKQGRNHSRVQEGMFHCGDHRLLQQRQCSCLEAESEQQVAERPAPTWPEVETRLCGAPKATSSPPWASGLFVTEHRAAHFRREANRFRDLPLPGLQHGFIKYFREQKDTSKARGLCSCRGWKLESGGPWLHHSLYNSFVFPSSMVPINFKTEAQPTNVESIKG